MHLSLILTHTNTHPGRFLLRLPWFVDRVPFVEQHVIQNQNHALVSGLADGDERNGNIFFPIEAAGAFEGTALDIPTGLEPLHQSPSYNNILNHSCTLPPEFGSACASDDNNGYTGNVSIMGETVAVVDEDLEKDLAEARLLVALELGASATTV